MQESCLESGVLNQGMSPGNKLLAIESSGTVGIVPCRTALNAIANTARPPRKHFADVYASSMFVRPISYQRA